MMHRAIRVLVVLLIVSLSANAQIKRPAKWTFEVSKTSVKVGDVIELIFKAKIDDGWYMYSSDFDPDCGPLPTEIKYPEIRNFELVGKLQAIKSTEKTDPNFPDCEVIRVFKKTGEFRQKIKITGSPVSIPLTIDFQTCTDLDGTCVPLEEDYTFTNIAVASGGQQSTPVEKKNNEKTESPDQAEEKKSVFNIDTTNALNTKTNVVYGENKGPILDASILEGKAEEQQDSLLSYMLLAFVLGLTSLITPCVFPMIPMTVTFFLKDNQTRAQGIRKAILFGVSIIVIYTIAGTIFALAFGAEGLNALATHWIPNLFIFAMFIVFALSFLGLFEINAPYKLVNKADQAAERGGYVGVFFMSATLVLVSFSCTIPIVGNVLVLAAGGKIVTPVLGMLAYSAAFAIPFTLFAFFPEWMKGLPKSGGWLNTVKVTLGLLELALAFKFLSIVDQTYHWGILDREINIGIWIVIFTILGFYFLGKIRMSSDAVIEKVTVSRLLLAIATFSFVVYLIPGLWGAPLKALAGYLPPMYTHDFDLIKLTRGENTNETCEEPKYSEFLHLPHGLNGYFDYDQALACARKLNKPLFIDFTGHGCTNCREMEANVWSDPQVLEKLKNDCRIKGG